MLEKRKDNDNKYLFTFVYLCEFRPRQFLGIFLSKTIGNRRKSSLTFSFI